MNKKLMVLLLFLLLQSRTAYAHTALTGSTPADGDVLAEEVHQIVLEFNTVIEPTSTVTVTGDNGEEIEISHIHVDGDVMTGAFPSPLSDGTYTVNWRIIGADGHPIQGNYSFEVNQGEPEEPSAGETPTPPVEENTEQPEGQTAEATPKIASNDVLVIILVALFTIAGGLVGWMIGRGRKK
jgi:copper resistance protein C